MKKLRTVWEELNRSIFVGERRQNNLRVLTYVSLFTAALGLVLVVIDVRIGASGVSLIPAFATLAGGLGCAYFAAIRKNREIACVFPCAFCLVMFTIYVFTGFMQGTAIFWSLLLPIGISYFVGVKYGIFFSLYYSVLYAVLFYTPLRVHIEAYYPEQILLRFPILFISVSAFTFISMVQYHRMVLRDIDYTERLDAEVKKQTAMAVERADSMLEAAEVARFHHERYDGCGYPTGSRGEEIPLHARVVTVADSYDAMRSDRIYRKGLAPDAIRAELVRGRGTQFDPTLLDAFLALADNGVLDAVTEDANERLARAVELDLIGD